MTPARASDAARAAAKSAGLTGRFLLGVLVKAALLFAALNLLFAALYPMDALGRISFYNVLFPGRQRLPFGENQAQAYNLSLYNLPAMFASQRLNGAPKPASEYRVLVIGEGPARQWFADRVPEAGPDLHHRVVRRQPVGHPHRPAEPR